MLSAALPAEAETALQRFRRFYGELFLVKRLLEAKDWAAFQGGRAAAGTPEEQVLLAVRARLRGAIATQGFGGQPPANAPAGLDPGYIWAALADAALLHDIDWPGREGWADRPLETDLYSTRIAGDRIINAVDELVRHRGPDPDGVAMTILLALAMGYRGRYRGHDDRGKIDDLKNRLLETVFRGSTARTGDFGGLTVGAAEPLDQPGAAGLLRLRPWIMAMVGIVVAYLLVTWWMWWGDVRDIVATASRAMKALELIR